VVVFGGGSFGTAMGTSLAHKKPSLDVVLLLRDPYMCKDINTRHVNSKYLPVSTSLGTGRFSPHLTSPLHWSLLTSPHLGTGCFSPHLTSPRHWSFLTLMWRSGGSCRL
jgi:glycerol-3-phosphate dehydrogenase